ncbi:MAG: hypothetical protein HKN87_22445 [Saprospiraceae bacterium]|nr:hypothetical protein [Saprospiraceae bacterium]
MDSANMNIKGTVVKVNLEGGFWGIEDESGTQWLPVNMPDQLKVEGASVEIAAKRVDVMSIYNWGTTIEIISFHTLPRF